MKRVQPRPPTPRPVSPDSSEARLPPELLNDQIKRLEVFSLIGGGLWAIGLLMDALVLPAAVGVGAPRSALVIESGGVLVAAGVYAWVRLSKGTAQTKADAGSWLMLLNCAAIALLETWVSDPRLMLGHLSWSAIVILLCAMILPSTPTRMLVSGLAAASLGPLGVWLAHLRGVDVPSVLNTFLMYMPNYSCAIAAVVPSRMMQRLGRSLKEARDLGSYELEERLGEGGMGEVWRARHRLLARPAAIKLVRPATLATATGEETRRTLRRFEDEAQATAMLTSPHTIRLFDFGLTDDGSFYYVMELLAGRDMASLVSEFGPLPVPRVLFLLRQVCHSLAEAHGRGLVHRDVKPANIFVCRMGLDYDFVKVLDFGLVQAANPDPGEDLTQSLASVQGIMGTPAFMAPEAIVRQTAVDHRADIYALGCVAYFLLTGQQVFQGGTQMQTLIEHVSTVPAPPSSRTTNRIPRSVDALVLACLEKDRDRRPADAMAVADAMAACEDAGGWSNAEAARWWHAHLPDLAVEPMR